MKHLIIISTLFILVHYIYAKSKPMDGINLYLIGEPKTGEPWTNAIPQGESGVYSICETKDGGVLAGTCSHRGKKAWLFYFDTKTKAIKQENILPLEGTLSGQTCVTALVQGGDSLIYGAASNYWDLDYKYDPDVKESSYEGGHLFRATITNGKIAVTDLGAAVKGEGIAALIKSRDGQSIYGLTTPSQTFFALDIKTGKVAEIGNLPKINVEYKRYIGKSSRALCLDDSGNVYGSAASGKMFKFSLSTKKIDTLSTSIPNSAVSGNYDCIASFVRTNTGKMYAGTFLDGKLIEVTPGTASVKELGITSRSGNLTALAEKNGIIYGLSGSKASGSTIFAYNPVSGQYYYYPGVKVYYENTPSKAKWVPRALKNLIVLKSGLMVAGEDDQPGRFYTMDLPAPVWVK